MVREALGQIDAQVVLVAVSGGPDSMCLLRALVAAAPDRSLVACTVHHGLRPEADAEIELVAAFCRERGIRHVVRHAPVAAVRKQTRRSLQTVARELRYQALRDAAASIGAGAIALGHTRDDQVETILMHVLRGSGLRGLSGMQLWSDGLLRPLLGLRRADSHRYCELLDVPHVHDPSNLDLTADRNRLREVVIPALEAFHPGLADHLIGLAESASIDDRFLAEVTAAFQERVVVEGALHARLWASLPEAIRRRMLLQNADASRDQIRNRSAQLAKAAADVPHWRAPAWWPQLSREPSLIIPVPGILHLESFAVEAQFVPVQAALQRLYVAGPLDLYLDWSGPAAELGMRRWRQGDRIRPLGMRGTRKLQDVFVDAKVPAAARQRWPVMEVDGVITWVPGLIRADTRPVSAMSGRVLHLRLVREDDGSRLEPAERRKTGANSRLILIE